MPLYISACSTSWDICSLSNPRVPLGASNTSLECLCSDVSQYTSAIQEIAVMENGRKLPCPSSNLLLNSGWKARCAPGDYSFWVDPSVGPLSYSFPITASLRIEIDWRGRNPCALCFTHITCCFLLGKLGAFHRGNGAFVRSPFRAYRGIKSLMKTSLRKIRNIGGTGNVVLLKRIRAYFLGLGHI